MTATLTPRKRGVDFVGSDGATHTIRFSLNAMVLFEEQTGLSIAQALAKGDMKSMRLLLWAGLLHENSDITVEDAGDLVELGDLKVIMEGVRKRVESSDPIDAAAVSNTATKTATAMKPQRPESAAIEPSGSIGGSSGVLADTISDLTS